MLYRLVRPVKRKGSTYEQFHKRIPADVKPLLAGRPLTIPLGDFSVTVRITDRMDSVRFSLRSRDPSTVKIRQAAAAGYLEQVFEAYRRGAPLSLTHRQAIALSGELYRAWANGEDRERSIAMEHTPEGGSRVDDDYDSELEHALFEHTANQLGALLDTGDNNALEKTVGPIIDRLLLEKGISAVDARSRQMLLSAFGSALRQAMEVRHRQAGGDYSPDPQSERFPEWQSPRSEAEARPIAGKASLKGLVDDWWKEAEAAGRKPSTLESYRNTINQFVAFLKHDDALRVQSEDVIAFKDHRLQSINPRTGKRISAKTVKDSDLAGLKTIFGWAVANRRLKSNPAEGVTIKVGKRTKVRSLGFTEEEAKAILRSALAHDGGREKSRTAAAKRWVPWLEAYTGARVGEVAQLRKEDLRKEGREWVIRITPEAGTVKTNEARDVVLHPHLVKLGFVDFVESATAGHLFLKPAEDGSVRGPLRGLKNRLASFARETVKDPNVAPNHGWRHRFKTVGREAEIDQRILDAIQGQSPRTVGETYGDVTIKTIAKAIRKLPRYEV